MLPTTLERNSFNSQSPCERPKRAWLRIILKGTLAATIQIKSCEVFICESPLEKRHKITQRRFWSSENASAKKHWLLIWRSYLTGQTNYKSWITYKQRTEISQKWELIKIVYSRELLAVPNRLTRSSYKIKHFETVSPFLHRLQVLLLFRSLSIPSRYPWSFLVERPSQFVMKNVRS